jgi:hypothetical protein
MRSLLRALIALLFLSCLTAGCSKDGQLTGDVFIVTAGGQSIPLGLILIQVFPEEVFFPFLEAKIARAKTEMEKLEPQLTAAEATAKEAQDVAKRADPWDIGKRREADARLADFRALVDRAGEWRLPKYYFEDLPTPLVTTRSDANGRFNLTLNRSKRYVLAAQGSRLVGDTPEKYFWCLEVSLNGKKAGRILVSNDTFFDFSRIPTQVQVE